MLSTYIHCQYLASMINISVCAQHLHLWSEPLSLLSTFACGPVGSPRSALISVPWSLLDALCQYQVSAVIT